MESVAAFWNGKAGIMVRHQPLITLRAALTPAVRRISGGNAAAINGLRPHRVHYVVRSISYELPGIRPVTADQFPANIRPMDGY
jgi:hypothetical protein